MRHAAWVRVIERIYQEQVAHAWGHYVFRLLRAVFTTNTALSQEGGFVFDWMVRNYVDSTLMLIRRELDLQAGAESLKNLLLDMIAHPTVVTRERYLANWDEPVRRWAANRMFDQFVSNSDADHLSPDLINADLARLDASADHLRKYAERTKAHRTPEQGLTIEGMTFAALHEAIATVRDVIAKYYALLTHNSLAQWEPVAQFNTLQAFTKPWVLDRSAVNRAINEER